MIITQYNASLTIIYSLKAQVCNSPSQHTSIGWTKRVTLGWSYLLLSGRQSVFVEPVCLFCLFGEAGEVKITLFSLKEPNKGIQYKYTRVYAFEKIRDPY